MSYIYRPFRDRGTLSTSICCSTAKPTNTVTRGMPKITVILGVVPRKNKLGTWQWLYLCSLLMSVTSVSGSRAEYWPDNRCSRWIWGDAKVRNNDFRIQLEMVLGTASRFCHPDFKIQMRSLGQFPVPEHEIMPIKYFFFKCRDVGALPGLWQPVLSEALHAALQTSRRYQTYSHLDNVILVLKTLLSSKTFKP